MKRKHSHRLCIVIGSIVGILLVLIVIAVFWVNRRLCFVDYTPYNYSESSDAISNPYIGWYTIRGYFLAEDASFSLPEASTTTTSAPGLSLIEINLKNYANCDLTDTALDEIDSILSAWANTGSQLILRFLYDWDGQNLESEPNELSQILTHMEQVGPIVNKYAASVYLMQGIFVGNWGEMNNTIHMGNEEMETLVQKLAEVIDPSIFLSVRTPAQWRTIVGEGDQENENNTAGEKAGKDMEVDLVSRTTPQPALFSLASRLGLYNDGMLGSANDTGTYGDKVAADADTNYIDAWTRDDELAFQNELCRYVPNGGEVIIDNDYNDFDSAIKDLAQMHVSYLNSAYDGAVLNKWKETTVNETTMIESTMIESTILESENENTTIRNSKNRTNSDLWNGMSGYDYIERHLGYRYVLDNSSVKFHPLFDDTGILTVNVRNVGFSNCYRPLAVTVYVVSDLTGECVAETTVDTDPRLWNSGEASTFTVPIDVRSLHNQNDTTNDDINIDANANTNTYTLYLKCSDTTLDRTILFANTQTLTEYGYELGSIAISRGFQK